MFMDRFVIRQGWDQAGRTGTILGCVHVEQHWAVVLFDDDEDPETVKLAALEIIPRKEDLKATRGDRIMMAQERVEAAKLNIALVKNLHRDVERMERDIVDAQAFYDPGDVFYFRNVTCTRHCCADIETGKVIEYLGNYEYKVSIDGEPGTRTLDANDMSKHKPLR
jgi:hypothetical protein